MSFPEVGGELVPEPYPSEVIEMFGADRLAQIAGNEALPESAQELIGVVKILCVDAHNLNPGGTFGRNLDRGDSTQHRLRLTFDPSAKAPTADSELHRDIVSLTYYKSGRLARSRGQSFGSRAFWHEDIYVDEGEVVRLNRYIATYKGNDFVNRQSASKPATEDEVQAALRALADAAYYTMTKQLE